MRGGEGEEREKVASGGVKISARGRLTRPLALRCRESVGTLYLTKDD